MSRKVFTAGEVLAAADVNSFLMDQSIMSFAGTAARGSAIPTPTLGMYTHLEDTPPRQEFWNGSAWVSPFGETLISTVSFTSQSTISLSSVFSSRYANYRAVVNITNASNNMDLLFRMRSGTTDNATAAYFSTGISTIQTTNTITVNNVNGGTLGYLSGAANTQTLMGNIQIYNPNISTVTYITNHFAGIFGDFRSNTSGSLFNTLDVFDGISFYASSGTLTGTIRLYGLRNS